VLREGLARNPRAAELHHALGLAQVRQKATADSLRSFKLAADLAPNNARFAYVHAIALHSSGKVDAAIARLQSALAMHPVDGDIISALASFYQKRGDSVQATRYMNRLQQLSVNR